jgi:nitrogen fixation/metabolism regulation signal transduction histidine kinase
LRELSLHILDIVQNSISAEASFIEMIIHEDDKSNSMTIEITDNGRGMSRELLEKVTNPFITTRKTRKVGLGISLFKAACERCNGKFYIDSKLREGTKIYASFEKNHIDRAPLGDMVNTIIILILSNEKIDYLYKHSINENEFILDTREVRKVLGDISLNNMEVIDWIKNHILAGLDEIKKVK